MVYMGRVNNGNYITCVEICSDNNEQVRKGVYSSGEPEAHTCCSPPPLYKITNKQDS